MVNIKKKKFNDFFASFGIGISIGIGLAAGFRYWTLYTKKKSSSKKKVSEINSYPWKKDDIENALRKSLEKEGVEDIGHHVSDIARTVSDNYQKKPAIMLTSTPFRLKRHGIRSGGHLRIIIVRHGESEGNIDASAYQEYGDHGVPLTKNGFHMAKLAGESIANHYKSLYNSPDRAPHIRIWMSPFVRTRQTARGLLCSSLRKWVTDIRENVDLVELDYGLLEGEGIRKGKELCKNQFARLVNKVEKNGKFYARYPNGESVHDVMGRTSHLLGTLFRDKEYHIVGSDGENCSISDVILVTHGITGRAMMMQWFCYGPEWYESSENLPNASVFYIDGTKTHPDFQGQFLFGGFGKGGIQNPIKIDKLNKHIQESHINEVKRQTKILNILCQKSKHRRNTRTKSGSIVSNLYYTIPHR